MFSRVAKPSSIAIALVLAGTLATLAGCGSGDETPTQEGTDYTLEVNEASLGTKQRLAETSDLVISVTNVGSETIPDLSATISTRASDLSPEQAGIANGSFSIRIDREDVAIRTRPVWILNADWPRLNGASTAAGAERAQTNTYAFGELPPGEQATMVWNLNAVQTGNYIVSWRLSPGLASNDRAVDSTGAPVGGEIQVEIIGQPEKLRVDEKGDVVPVPSN